MIDGKQVKDRKAPTGKGKFLNQSGVYEDTYTAPVFSYLFTDFFSNNASQNLPFAGSAVGGGSSPQNTGYSVSPGVVTLRSTTASNSGYRWQIASMPLLDKSSYFDVYLKLVVTAGTTIRAGCHNSTTSAAPTAGVYFELINGSDLYFINSYLSTETRSFVGSYSNSNWLKISITINDDITQSTINVKNLTTGSTTTVTNSGNIPLSFISLLCGIIATNSGVTTQDLCNVDKMGIGYNDNNRGRI